ncbi:MAG: DUF4886 domain-containing protein [Lachnospiraceae bacterium]
MKRKFAGLIAMTMICCLILGTVTYAEDPEVTSSQTEDLSNEGNDGTTVTDSSQSDSSENEETESGSSEREGSENGSLEGEEAESGSSEGEEAESGSSEGEETVKNTENSTGATGTTSPSTTTSTQSITPIPKSKKIRVLLVGNSLTHAKRNTSVYDLKMLAKKAGRKLVVKYLTYNDEKLKNWANPNHKNGKRLRREIKNSFWNYVIFQEQTSAAVTSSFYKAAKKLSTYIHTTSPKTKIIYNCTWAYKKGKKVAGKFYSFSNMQAKMNSNYAKVSKATGDRVCWSGKAFLKYRKRKGSVNLYRKDNNHASRYGWYLNACCMYASIFGVSPEESKYSAGLNKKRVKVMQKIAAEINLY